jgi:hypothetical protein
VLWGGPSYISGRPANPFVARRPSIFSGVAVCLDALHSCPRPVTETDLSRACNGRGYRGARIQYSNRGRRNDSLSGHWCSAGGCGRRLDIRQMRLVFFCAWGSSRPWELCEMNFMMEKASQERTEGGIFGVSQDVYRSQDRRGRRHSFQTRYIMCAYAAYIWQSHRRCEFHVALGLT